MKKPLKSTSKTKRYSNHFHEVTEAMYAQAIQVMVPLPCASLLQLGQAEAQREALQLWYSRIPWY